MFTYIFFHTQRLKGIFRRLRFLREILANSKWSVISKVNENIILGLCLKELEIRLSLIWNSSQREWAKNETGLNVLKNASPCLCQNRGFESLGKRQWSWGFWYFWVEDLPACMKEGGLCNWHFIPWREGAAVPGSYEPTALGRASPTRKHIRASLRSLGVCPAAETARTCWTTSYQAADFRHFHGLSEPGPTRTAATKTLGSDAKKLKTFSREEPLVLETFADFQDSEYSIYKSWSCTLARCGAREVPESNCDLTVLRQLSTMSHCIRHRQNEHGMALLCLTSALLTFCWDGTRRGRRKEDWGEV